MPLGYRHLSFVVFINNNNNIIIFVVIMFIGSVYAARKGWRFFGSIVCGSRPLGYYARHNTLYLQHLIGLYII